jgi:hypothetical protein
MTTNFFHPSLLLLCLDPGSEIRDPGWVKSGSGIRDKHSGSAIEHQKIYILNFIITTTREAWNPSISRTITSKREISQFVISGSDFLTSYGSGSASQKITVPPVLVPQHCKQQQSTTKDS